MSSCLLFVHFHKQILHSSRCYRLKLRQAEVVGRSFWNGKLPGDWRWVDVTVTAKWPLWVLRNDTPFTPSHFRQSSEQIFLVLVFVFLKTVFLEFVSNALWTTYLKSKTFSRHFLDRFLPENVGTPAAAPRWRRQQCENFALLSHYRFGRLHGFSTSATRWWLACNTIETHEPAGEFRVCEL